MVSPVSVWGRRHGGGCLWMGKPYRHYDDGTNGEVCGDCGGGGTMLTPAPTLELAID